MPNIDWLHGARNAGPLLTGLLVGTLALAGCSDSGEVNRPVTKPGSELEFVPIKVTAPPLETVDTTFWAVRGQERGLEVRFAGQGGPGTGTKFLELEIGDGTLLRRPDGSSFAVGDSIEIRVIIDSDFYIVTFEPAGLVFNPAEPARFEIDYDEAEEDFLLRESDFDVWRQEMSADPWEQQVSLQIEELDEIEVLLLGFTRYALAIGR